VTERRFTRTMVLCLAATAVAFGAVVTGPILTQSGFETPLWAVASLLIVFGSPVATAVAALAGSDRGVRAGLVLTSAGFVVLLLTLELGLRSGTLPPEAGAPWILGITPLAAATAALVLPPLAAWGYSLALAALVAVARMLAFPESIADVALQDALVALLLQSVFAGLTLATLRAARSLDAAATAARAQAVADAQAEARAREQRHTDALIHDTVLATLLLAARGSSGAPDQRAAELARRGLQQIEQLAAPTVVAGPVGGQELVGRVQALTTDLDPYAEFVWTVASELELPAMAADVVVDAVAEALRNSLEHAGAEGVARTVVVDVRDRELHVAVLDDGAGFDLAAVRPDRLGIRLSVTERLAALVGGRALVSSQPGEGTSVVIRWRADAAG
jgi:signal transduction histidine kinase